jgi:hypothetical protein
MTVRRIWFEMQSTRRSFRKRVLNIINDSCQSVQNAECAV